MGIDAIPVPKLQIIVVNVGMLSAMNREIKPLFTDGPLEFEKYLVQV